MSDLKQRVEAFAEKNNARVTSRGVNYHTVIDKHKNEHVFSRFPNGPITYAVNGVPKPLPNFFLKNLTEK